MHRTHGWHTHFLSVANQQEESGYAKNAACEISALEPVSSMLPLLGVGGRI